MLSFFRLNTAKEQLKNQPIAEKKILTTDIHSHLLPGIDDGSKSMEESLSLIQQFLALGYTKLITTPHIMADFYRNTPDIIQAKLLELKDSLQKNNLTPDIEAAAEYYLDEWFLEKLENEEPLLTFGANYLLFETSFINEPKNLLEAIFKMQTLGYKPVFAHPERYTYLYNDFKLIEKIHQQGVLLQININSLAGYYSKKAQNFAEELIEKNMVSFAGSDCHGQRHLDSLKNLKAKNKLAKLLKGELLNNQL